jgi:hypothetical protein
MTDYRLTDEERAATAPIVACLSAFTIAVPVGITAQQANWAYGRVYDHVELDPGPLGPGSR